MKKVFFSWIFIAAIVLSVPFFLKARNASVGYTNPATNSLTATAQLNGIAHNLRLIESAKELWFFQNNKSYDTVVVMPDLAPYFKNQFAPGSYVREIYFSGSLAIPAFAVLPEGLVLNGMSGTLSLTNF